ncbi:hypothetical protein RhiJN_22310 [Ceratobasidium sp. AG-Ba]|nr:hypothetical protein RhiJN_22310 [Ceratobasidium sp. AG-Ba]
MPSIIIPVQITLETEPRPFVTQVKLPLFFDDSDQEFVDIKDLIEQLLKDVFYYKAFAKYDRLFLNLPNRNRHILLWNFGGKWIGTITARGVYIPVARKIDVTLTLPSKSDMAGYCFSYAVSRSS